MNAERAARIRRGLDATRRRVGDACAAAGRADEVELVVVTKTFPAEDVAFLAELGVTDVGENRDQEARSKRADLPPDLPLTWHMLGRLQRNKVTSVARWADCVDSVDRIEVAHALGRAAGAAGRVIEVLVQVALDPVRRAERGGVDPELAMTVAQAVAVEPALRLRGVMGVAPFPGDPDAAFALLAGVHGSIRDRWPDADRMSAGMSSDLEQAIARGATQVRVGGAILGDRTPVQ